MADGENGFFIVPNWVTDDENLTRSEQNVLVSLFRHYNKERQRAWPSIELIAKEARITWRWVIPTLKSLEEKGYIRTEKKVGCATQYEIKTPEFTSGVNSVHPCTQFSEPLNSVQVTPEVSTGEPLNSVQANNTSITRLKNNTREQVGRLSSSDPWIRDQLAAIRQVVEAPRPGTLPELLAQWRETYGQQAVEQAIRKAMRWMQDNRKRYADMGRFLGRWLARDAERATPRKFSAPDYGDKPKSWRELMPAFYEEGQHDGQ